MIEIWVVSGLLSLWYFLRASKYYPDMYKWANVFELTFGDAFVILAIIIGGCISLSFVILLIHIKSKEM